jgi:hypothetical protein
MLAEFRLALQPFAVNETFDMFFLPGKHVEGLFFRRNAR